MRLNVDHVVFGGTNLDDLTERAGALGFEGVYGGTHADGTTHMRVVPFRDGSYLELIAPTDGTDPATAGYWPARLGADAGPAAWCLRGTDARSVACEAVRSGFTVHGPTPGGRTTTDGIDLEWDAVVLAGDAADPTVESHPESGSTSEVLPFVCVDRTPRTWRVPPEHAHVGPASGVGAVLLAVEDGEAWASRFRRLAGLPTPAPVDLPGVAGTAVAFPGSPVVLVEPDAGGPLAERVERVGPGPCGYLLAVDAVEDARDAYPLGDAWTLSGGRGDGGDGDHDGEGGHGGDRREAAWFDGERGTLGVVSERRRENA